MQIDNKVFVIDGTLEELKHDIQKITPEEALKQITQSNQIFGHKFEAPDDLILLGPPFPNYFKLNKHKGFRNQFAECIRLSYKYHIPLELGPDQIWLAIMQAFAIHVNKNSEKLRQMFVKHQGKKELKIIREETDLYNLDWDNITRDFSYIIKENIGDDCFNLCVPKFSTTKPEYTTAFQINIMGTMKNYFHYKFVMMCGIPKIKLLGTQEDWDELRARVNSLRQYELEDWINHLLPVLDKIIHLFKTGEVDLVFWNDIYHFRNGGGSGESASAFGWITLFFPYTTKKQYNQPDTSTMYDFPKSPINSYNYYQVDPESVPNGVTDVPVHYSNLISKVETKLTFRSGFCGISRKDGYLKPVIGWLIMDDTDPRVGNQIK